MEEVEPGGGQAFPESLCHLCAAPARFIRTERSTFLFCPILKRYPPQPVTACGEFVPKVAADGRAGLPK